MHLFDVNCAVGAWSSDRLVYETVDGLLSEMARLGIGRALVSHTLAQSYDPLYGNRVLMSEIAGCEQLFPCWTLLPLSCSEMGTLDELLAEMSLAGVRAVRFYPRAHTFSLDDWQCGDLLSALAERRYVVLLDLDQIDGAGIDAVCRAYPALSWVLTKTGYRQFRPLFALMRRHSNLYCDLSLLSLYLGVEEILARFGSDRLLFGTGLPRCDPGGPIARLFYTDAPQTEIAAMAYGNVERLLARVQLEKGVRS